MEHPKLMWQDIVVIINGMENPGKMKDVLKYKTIAEKYLPIIQDNTEPSLDILTESSTDRYVIYKLCDILKINHERIDEHNTRTFKCCQFFGPCSDPMTGCGCADVPNRIKKYEVGLDYDDRYTEYKMPWTYKIGVRIFKRD